MKQQTGFTLNELVITVALVGIVTAIGLPAMGEFVKNDRLTTQINVLVGHLAMARSQAVTLHLPVTVCASKNQSTCSSADWADGWIIYVDADSSGTLTVGDEVLRAQQALAGENRLSSTTGSAVTFDDRGFAPNGAGSFSLCDDRGTAHMKAISISITGRVRRGGSTSCT